MLLQLQTWPLPEHKHRCDSTTSSISLFFLLHHHFFPPLLPPHLPPTIFLTPDSPPSHLLTLLFLFASLPVSGWLVGWLSVFFFPTLGTGCDVGFIAFRIPLWVCGIRYSWLRDEVLSVRGYSNFSWRFVSVYWQRLLNSVAGTRSHLIRAGFQARMPRRSFRLQIGTVRPVVSAGFLKLEIVVDASRSVLHQAATLPRRILIRN